MSLKRHMHLAGLSSAGLVGVVHGLLERRQRLLVVAVPKKHEGYIDSEELNLAKIGRTVEAE